MWRIDVGDMGRHDYSDLLHIRFSQTADITSSLHLCVFNKHVKDIEIWPKVFGLFFFFKNYTID